MVLELQRSGLKVETGVKNKSYRVCEVFWRKCMWSQKNILDLSPYLKFPVPYGQYDTKPKSVQSRTMSVLESPLERNLENHEATISWKPVDGGSRKHVSCKSSS